MSMTQVKVVVILGAGPSGLLAAHAAVQAGFIVHLYTAWDRNNQTEPWKSKIYGCQYLHEEIPGLNAIRSMPVEYKLWGSAGVYRRRVYGSEFAGEVSPESLQGTSTAWDLRGAYDQLWDRYVDRGHPFVHVIPERSIGPDDVRYLQGCYPTIISTIPAKSLCSDDKHNFFSTQVWAIGDAPEIGWYAPASEIPDGTVICNGFNPPDGPHWYRSSRVFGHATVEWPVGVRPPKAVAVQKPIESNCTCLPGIHRMGRYGQWKKGVLTSDVYWDAVKLFSEI